MADKRFSEWEEVDCNECTHYWDDSCSGVSKGEYRNCTSFKATRNVVIPQQIKELQKDRKWITILLALQVIFDLVVAYNLVVINMGW